QKDETERHLEEDQTAPEVRTAAAAHHCARFVLHCSSQIKAAGAPRRYQTEEHRGGKTDTGAEQQNAPIDISWQIDHHAGTRRIKQHQHVAAEISYGETADGGEDGENQTFSEELTEQAGASGAHCEPDRH